MYASVGLALAQPRTVICARRARSHSATGTEGKRALALARKLWPKLGGRAGGVEIKVKECIPAHSGLGSGTQLALAVGSALSLLAGQKPDIPKLAELTGRGARSGIGLAAFQHGGLALDAGKALDGSDRAPPVLCRIAFPRSWSFVMVSTRRGRQGLHGKRERAFFDKPPKMDPEVAAMLCRVAMLELMPAAAEGDCGKFGNALSKLQEHVGDYFAAAQGGGRFSDTDTGMAVRELIRQGAVAGGQSSWGPTGFALFPSASEAGKAMAAVSARWRQKLSFSKVHARNSGARIDCNAIWE